MDRFKLKYVDGMYQIWDKQTQSWLCCDDGKTIWRNERKHIAIGRMREAVQAPHS